MNGTSSSPVYLTFLGDDQVHGSSFSLALLQVLSGPTNLQLACSGSMAVTSVQVGKGTLVAVGSFATPGEVPTKALPAGGIVNNCIRSLTPSLYPLTVFYLDPAVPERFALGLKAITVANQRLTGKAGLAPVLHPLIDNV